MKATLIKKADGWYNLYQDKIGIGSTHSELQGYKLSKQNCDEIFGVVDVEKLAKNEYLDGYDSTEMCRTAFKDGFNKAMELNKDKLFSLGDVETAMRIVFDWSEGDNHSECTSLNELLGKFQSLQQPTEIEVEIEMECLDPNCDGIDKKGVCIPGDKPKIDSKGCLILKNK